MRILLAILRILGGIQLLLGICFWLGYAITWIPLHMAIGVVFVLVLWIIGIIGATKGAGVGAAVGAIGWGILVAAIGMMQQRILIGEMHWIIRVTHLVIALASLPLAGVIYTRAQKAQSSHVAA
ncbi:MAG TPA: hypothetical protein VGM50_17810 [Gemmatimonadaceae bacterium]|jgi:hypothetical protein